MFLILLLCAANPPEDVTISLFNNALKKICKSHDPVKLGEGLTRNLKAIFALPDPASKKGIILDFLKKWYDQESFFNRLSRANVIEICDIFEKNIKNNETKSNTLCLIGIIKSIIYACKQRIIPDPHYLSFMYDCAGRFVQRFEHNCDTLQRELLKIDVHSIKAIKPHNANFYRSLRIIRDPEYGGKVLCCQIQ